VKGTQGHYFGVDFCGQPVVYFAYEVVRSQADLAVGAGLRAERREQRDQTGSKQDFRTLPARRVGSRPGRFAGFPLRGGRSGCSRM
jgi:hypothetical protein